MKSNGGRDFFRLIEIEGAHDFLYVATQIFPSVCFGHDAVGQAFRTKSAIAFLDYLKDKFVHGKKLTKNRCLHQGFRNWTALIQREQTKDSLEFPDSFDRSREEACYR